MPAEVILEVNPSFKPSNAVEKAAFDEAKAKPDVVTDAVNAREAIINSRGMYREKAPVQERGAGVGIPALSDLTIPELKQMGVQLGLDMTKQMKKSDLVALIQRKVDAIDVIDDDE